jgi:hypothetical protein
MADVAETIGGPPAVDQTGNLTLWFVPTIANPDAPTAAEIGAAGAFRFTYSLTPDGWSPSAPQEKNDDPRLTSSQRKQAFGIVNPDIGDLVYVDSSDPNSFAVKAAGLTAGHIIERRGVPNSTLIAAAQKVRTWKINLGKEAPGPVNGTGKFTLIRPVTVDYMSALVAVV